MTRYNYQQGQEVYFDVKVADAERMSGSGVIVGAATTGVPVLGVNYMVKPTFFTGDVVIPSEDYPFQCVSIAEIFLKPIPKVVEA